MSERPSVPSQATLARALGLSPAAVTKCKHLGMPVHSVQAARDWRAANLRLRIDVRGPGVRTETPLQRAERLGVLALDDFDAHAGELRAALRALSLRDSRRVQLDLEVWDRLHGPAFVAEMCDPSQAGQVEVDEATSDILFDLACGRRVYRGEET